MGTNLVLFFNHDYSHNEQLMQQYRPAVARDFVCIVFLRQVAYVPSYVAIIYLLAKLYHDSNINNM